MRRLVLALVLFAGPAVASVVVFTVLRPPSITPGATEENFRRLAW